jgi:hypothetical protein
MGTVVANENGIDIHCDETGKFSAYAHGASFTDRSLNKVRKWTATVKPTIALLEVDLEKGSYRTARGFRLAENVAEVRRDRDGKLIGVGPSSTSASRSRYNYAPTYRNLFLPDEAAQERIKALNEQLETWQAEVRERYNAAFDEIVAGLTPVDEENFAALLSGKGTTE